MNPHGITEEWTVAIFYNLVHGKIKLQEKEKFPTLRAARKAFASTRSRRALFASMKGFKVTIQFCNINGDPISLAFAANVRLKKSSPEAYHKGWRVVGYSPEQLLQARNNHVVEVDAAKAAGLPHPGPFDEDSFMRKTAPRKVRPAPYPLREAADQCADLARRAGWKNVRVEPVARGGR